MTSLSKRKYYTLPHEFVRVPHKTFTNLSIRPDIGLQERVVAILRECQQAFSLETITCMACSHGGYIPLHIAPFFREVFFEQTDIRQVANIQANIQEFAVSNIVLEPPSSKPAPEMVFLNDHVAALSLSSSDLPIVLSLHPDNHTHLSTHYKYVYTLSHTQEKWKIYIPENWHAQFCLWFSYFLDGPVLAYDNLVHFCMIVKNGGEQLEEMLKENMPHMDEWTIVDTGSTDDTVAIIERVLKNKKRGKLYHREFTNFRDTRNLCLDLAEKQASVPCKYTMMLDDTYVVRGNLRGFLMEVRGDQVADSFSMYITTDDTKYASNRLFRTETRLRYKHKIHEVLNDHNNVNVIMFEENANILDRRFPYMETRTMERKRQDLMWILEEIEENPTEPRHYYYLAQTYNLLGEYQKAFDAFQKRVEFKNSGFIQERVDAAFESARLANFQLKRPWEECLRLYEFAWRIDDTRPEALYFIGIHYFMEDQYKKAHQYFKQAFDIGFPAHCQHSLKPTLSFHFLPLYLAKTCYFVKDWELGWKSAEFFLKHNKPEDSSYNEVVSWARIYQHLLKYIETPLSLSSDKTSTGVDKPIVCFLADGGFDEWSGSSILKKGVGGSETYIIEMARHIQQQGVYQVVVFCRTSFTEDFEGVSYRPIDKWYSFVKSTYIHTCIISRFTEYVPVAVLGQVENLYIVLHDLIIPGTVVVNDLKLKKVFCLTPWHAQYAKEIFPVLADKIEPFSYGIRPEAFPRDVQPVPFSFIYSSFPDRGLLPLLQMWPKIIGIQPRASLNIYCDLQGEWVNRVQPEQMKLIRRFLETAPPHYNITSHGWVDKQTLFRAWATADIWFYPCIFKETFCMTALEAAASHTFVITNDLAALQDTVGKRGIVIPGDASTSEWQNRALTELAPYLGVHAHVLEMKNNLLRKNADWASTLTWAHQAKRLCQEYLSVEPYEYRGLYNWTHGLPTPADTQAFFDVLQRVREAIQGQPFQIMEIGTWTGMSVIRLLQELPSAVATVIDRWDNYEENGITMYGKQALDAFQRNVVRARVKHRIKIRQGDSAVVLQEMVREQQSFHFIYVDGSHALLDVFFDCMLAWTLLQSGGVLVIDDYLYRSDPEQDDPKRGIDTFMNKIQGQYKILHMGYRVFLEKTVLACYTDQKEL